jgi:hypothetical protein
VCRARNQRAWQLWHQHRLSPNAAVGLRIDETLRIAAIGIRNPSLYPLRARILEIKRRLNAEGRRMLKARGTRFERLGDRFVAHAHQVGRHLEELGLPECNTRS